MLFRKEKKVPHDSIFALDLEKWNWNKSLFSYRVAFYTGSLENILVKMLYKQQNKLSKELVHWNFLVKCKCTMKMLLKSVMIGLSLSQNFKDCLVCFCLKTPIVRFCQNIIHSHSWDMNYGFSLINWFTFSICYTFFLFCLYFYTQANVLSLISTFCKSGAYRNCLLSLLLSLLFQNIPNPITSENLYHFSFIC